ncbi:MAG: hypothetical protein FWD79_09740 [Desulfobulbus sp.]|nr:hypothetical protein [Desulfobulbus sp.]
MRGGAPAALGQDAEQDNAAQRKREEHGRSWAKTGADTLLAEAVYPDGFCYSTQYLCAYYAGKSDADELLMACPLTRPAWGWRSRKWCRTCKGHRHCLAEFLLSPQMLAPMETEHV